MRVFHPIQKHIDSEVHPSSHAIHASTDLFTKDAPLAYEIRTIQKTILRRRSQVGSSGLLIQKEGWSNLAPLGSPAASEADDDDLIGWDEIKVDAPDLTNKATVVNLARIANDAYASPGDSRWMELDKFNLVSSDASTRPTFEPNQTQLTLPPFLFILRHCRSDGAMTRLGSEATCLQTQLTRR